MSETVEWYPKIKDCSLALAVRETGFDLTMFKEYSESTQIEIRKKSISCIMQSISYLFEETTGRNIHDIKRGVYVICLSHPFTVSYKTGCSEILYIGIGQIYKRLESHFNNNLFDFMMSIAGSNFDFYLTEPKGSPGDHYYKHIEYMLLSRFYEKHDEYPLLNTNAGSQKDFDAVGKGWDKPLKGSGKKPEWQIRPTKYCPFAKLEE